MQGITKRSAPAWDDADFVDRICMQGVGGDKRVTNFMISDTTFFLVIQATAFPFWTAPCFARADLIAK